MSEETEKQARIAKYLTSWVEQAKIEFHEVCGYGFEDEDSDVGWESEPASILTYADFTPAIDFEEAESIVAALETEGYEAEASENVLVVFNNN